MIPEVWLLNRNRTCSIAQATQCRLLIWYAAAAVAWEGPRSDQRTCARDAFGRTARALPDRAPLVSIDICMAAIAVLYKRVMTLYTGAGCARRRCEQGSKAYRSCLDLGSRLDHWKQQGCMHPIQT